MTAKIEAQLGSISPRTIDLRLKHKKHQLKNSLYGRTKPGSLLKHHIPLKTDCWDVTTPGFTEVDLVSHSGHCAEGEFLYSLNMTDIHTTWVETRAVMGKGQERVKNAMKAMRRALPLPCWASIPTMAPSSSITTCIGTAKADASNLRGDGLTKKTTMPTSSRRI